MHRRDETANESVVKPGVTQPVVANQRFADFLISGLLLLMAIGGFAM
jgi:hypothetical protein